VVSANPYENEGKPGTIGQPLPATNVRLVDKGDEAGAAAFSTGLDRYGLPEVVAHATTPEAARAAAWSLVRRVLASGGALAEAPGITEATHPEGGARRLLQYSVRAR